MPTLVNLHDRETVDLHAHWWSEGKDESGRYLERVVVYCEMTERDEQAVAKQVVPKVRPGQGRDAGSISMDQTVFARMHLFLRMIVEMTDATGRPLPLNSETIGAMKKKDSTWIQQEIDEMNKPPIEPTAEDEADAERSEGEMTPGELSERRFRSSRHKAIRG